jgi:hyperpolarization activated cyclic nucleotide-gated potassium channel 2
LSTTFLLDLLTTIPFDAIAGAVGNKNPQTLRLAKLMRMFRLARLAKLVMLLKNGRVFEATEDVLANNMHDGVGELISLFAALFFCAHLIGCLWFWVGSLSHECEDPVGRTGCGATWMTNYWGEGWDSGSSHPNNRGVGSQYITSIYWALSTMTTVGYGDISASPRSNAEMVVSMASMLAGTTVFAYVMSQMLQVVLNLDPSGDELKKHKALSKSFTEMKNLPSSFKEIARSNLCFVTDYITVCDVDAIFAIMPEYLLVKLVNHQWTHTIGRHGWITGLERKVRGFSILYSLYCTPTVLTILYSL